jgi:hypothetical protein
MCRSGLRTLPKNRRPHRKQRHNAGSLSFDAVVTYPFHPLYGQTIEVTGSIEHDFCRHLLIRQDHGGAFYLPAWMITPEAGLIKPIDTPRLPVERLHDLRALLDLLLLSHADESVSTGDVDAKAQSTRSVFLSGANGALEPRRSPDCHNASSRAAAGGDGRTKAIQFVSERKGGRQ